MGLSESVQAVGVSVSVNVQQSRYEDTMNKLPTVPSASPKRNLTRYNKIVQQSGSEDTMNKLPMITSASSKKYLTRSNQIAQMGTTGMMGPLKNGRPSKQAKESFKGTLPLNRRAKN